MIFIIILFGFNLGIIVLLSNIKNPIKKLDAKDIFKCFTEHELIETSKDVNYDHPISEVFAFLDDEKNKKCIKDIKFYE